MILILGSSHDDVLYFESIMTKKHKTTILGRYPVTFGHVLNQDIALVSEVYTNYVSSIVTQYMISKYFIILVINIGSCIGYSKDINPYDIAVSTQVMLADVDQVATRPVKIGQIPGGFGQFYKTEKDVMAFVKRSVEARIPETHFGATYLSSSTFFTRQEQIDPYLVGGELISVREKVVLDCTYGGVSLACQLLNISCFAIKAVEAKFTEKINFEEYQALLERYKSIGKAIVTIIGDIGRNDILQEVSV